MCGYSKSNCKIAFFKFPATFQILCNISNSLHHFKFASWLWILCSLAGLVTDGQNEYCENWRRWLKEIKKVEKSESWVFPPWAPWSWRPRTTRPSHTVRILSIGYNYNIFFVFSITSIIICWNKLWPRKIFFSVLTAFCLPRLEPGSWVCFEYPLPSDRFSLKMIHVKEM